MIQIFKNFRPRVATGESSLREAIALRPDYFDALSSLGGVLKRLDRMKDAYDLYAHAVDISQGNSYPLLNALTIKSQMEKSWLSNPNTV